MKVSIFQQDIAWGDPAANLSKLDTALAECPGSDLYVFPEMFTTGFATKPGSKIDDTPDITIEWMRSKAAAFDCAMAGSVAMKGEDGKRVNRFCFVTPDGKLTIADKRHLFTYGGEPETFTPGSDRVVVEFRGVRFLILVCYDLRFPVWSRNRADYDAVIYVANWPDVRQHAWDTLIQARAIENQCYVIAANRCGEDPVCKYLGGSAVVSPFGDVLARAEDYREQWVTADLDMAVLKAFIAKFPVLEDADDFRLL